MDEYIKKSEAVDVIVKYPYDIAGKTATAIRMIENLPSADVVPKSEVEKLVQDGTRLGQENETLKDNNEHLAVILEETKAEIERLQSEKDALIKNYAECMKDYAREIFAEVNMQIFPYSTDIYIKGEELIIIPKSDYNAILDEIKKKYTECEQ